MKYIQVSTPVENTEPMDSPGGGGASTLTEGKQKKKGKKIKIKILPVNHR